MKQRDTVLAEFSKWGWDQKGWSPTTRNRYARRALAAEMWLYEHRGVSIRWATPKDLQAYLFTASTARNRNNIRQALIGFGDFLVDRGYADVNNATTLKRLPEPRLLPRALTEDQAYRIEIAARSFPLEQQTLILCLLYTGLRKTELRLLERRHIINNEYLHFTGKGNKDRVVPLHPQVAVVLSSWLSQNTDARWVFSSTRYKGRPISDTTFRLWVKRVGEDAGVPELHPHACRHTFATTLAENDAKLEEIQELLGHADPKTTRIYVEVRPVRLKDVIGHLSYGGSGADRAGSRNPDPGPLLV